MSSLTDPLVRHTYFSGVYGPIQTARQGGDLAPRMAFKLPEPDPWLIAVTGIMWEGIIQGLAWDAVKAMVQAAIATLRGKGLAPTDAPEPTRRTRGRVEIGFHYSVYATDHEKQKDLFIGYRRQFDQMGAIERLHPTRPAEWTEARDKYLTAARPNPEKKDRAKPTKKGKRR